MAWNVMFLMVMLFRKPTVLRSVRNVEFAKWSENHHLTRVRSEESTIAFFSQVPDKGVRSLSDSTKLFAAFLHVHTLPWRTHGDGGRVVSMSVM